MKKFIMLMLVCALAATFVSCGNSTVKDVENPVDTDVEVSSEAESEAVDEPEAVEQPEEKEIIIEVPEVVTKNDVTIMMDGILSNIPGIDNAEERIADALSRALNLSKVYTDADEELVKAAVEEHISYLGDFQVDNMKITVNEIESRVQAMIGEGNAPENYSEDGFSKVMQILKTALGM